MGKQIEFKVKYEDNTGGNDSIETYQCEEAAEAAIDEELENVKEYFRGREYDYGEFCGKDGLTTEIWVCGGNEYARWIRLWK